MLDVDAIPDASVFVLIGQLAFEFEQAGDETPLATLERVREHVREVMKRPEGERLFFHEAPQPHVRGPIAAAPVASFMHIPPGLQVQVIQGLVFKVFLREQRFQAARQQGMGLVRS